MPRTARPTARPGSERGRAANATTACEQPCAPSVGLPDAERSRQRQIEEREGLGNGFIRRSCGGLQPGHAIPEIEANRADRSVVAQANANAEVRSIEAEREPPP